jgi:hypothetical protein
MHCVCSMTKSRPCEDYRWVGVLVALLAMLTIRPSQAAEREFHPGSPPPEAISACAYKQPDAPCYFRQEYVTITGTCEKKTGDLVCVPDRPPPGPPPSGAGESASPGGGAGPAGGADPPGKPRGQSGPSSDGQGSQDRPPRLEGGPRPPPEAFDACALTSEGGRCVVKTPKGEIAGACGPYEGRLACIPPKPRERD